MPPRRKKSVSSPQSGVGSSVNRSGFSSLQDGDNISSIQQGIGSISRSNTHLRSHDPDTMMSPHHRHHQPPTHSPHYQPPYEQPHHNQPYSPPPPEANVYHTHPPTFYHSTNAGQQYYNSPDETHVPHPSTYPSRNRSPPANPPPNPHAPSHYNFANRAYAQQRDSGFNTFRVNPGPVPGPVAEVTSPVPPPVPHGMPPALAPPPSQLQRRDENPLQFHPRAHPQPPTPVSAPYPRLSPPLPPQRETETEYEVGNLNANGAGHWRSNRSRNRNGNGSPGPLTSSDDDDAPYDPATAGGRSKAMVKYLIMKAKYRYVLDEHALLKNELETLKKEEHEQWRLKEGGVDEIIKSFGSDSDRFLHDRDQQAQQYQLHHDSMDQDLLNELDRERHAFHTRERSRNSGRDREERAIDVDDNERGRNLHHARPITTDRNRYGDAGLASPMSLNVPLPLSESGRDNRHSERKRPRSSSGSRLETRLEPHMQSYHYPPHPYRRTPPPQSSAVEHESQPGPFPHPPQLRSSSPPFGLDRDARQYMSRRSDSELRPDGERNGPEGAHLPPRQQRQRSSFSTYGPGQGSPSSQGQRPSQYQSPPPSITSSHQQQSPQLPHPTLSPRSYRETTERSERHPTRREAEQVRQGRTFEYDYAPVPSVSAHRPGDESRDSQEERRSIPVGSRDASSPRPQPSESSLAQTRMQGRDLEQAFDTQAHTKRQRSSLEESAEGREDERMSTSSFEQRPTALRSPPTPQTRHSKYAYAYYPNESEGGAEDGDMTRKAENTVKDSNAEINKEGQGSASVDNLGRQNDELDLEAGTTTDADGVMDID